MAAQRYRILAAFRDLHRARKQVFSGDDHALSETRRQINEEFRKNLAESDPSKIEESLSLAKEVSMLLRKTVVQLRQKNDEIFELVVTKDTELGVNTEYDPAKELPVRPRGRKKSQTCCQEEDK